MSSIIHIEPLSRPVAEASGPLSRLCSFFIDIWRRVRMELVVEFPMLKDRWKTILFGLVFQYVHGIFTQLEKRLHQPQPQPLGDIGFKFIHELGRDKAWVSETIFYTLFLSFVIWILSPFVVNRKKFYTIVLVSRLLTVLATCQALRIVSFLSTQLPAPNYHCRSGEETANLDWPKHWYGHLIFDPAEQAAHGCGDLIFSSHTTFLLVGVLTYTTYGGMFILKVLVWILAAVLSLLIIASRKHYTVDIVVAWYTVPLVFYTFHRRWTTKRNMDRADSAEPSASSSRDDQRSPRDHLLNEFGGNKIEQHPLMMEAELGRISSSGHLIIDLQSTERESPRRVGAA